MVAHVGVERQRALGARGRQPADYLRRVAQRVVGAPGIDALGREGDVEVVAGFQPGQLLQHRHELLARGPRIGSRLEDNQLALLQHLAEARCGVLERRQVGLAVAGERRGHGDDSRLDLDEVRVARRGVQAAKHGREAIRWDVLDVALAALERSDAQGIDLDAPDLVTRLGERDRQRQAHISHSDDSDLHRE